MKNRIAIFLISTILLVNVSTSVFATNTISENQIRYNEISNDIKDLDAKISEYNNEMYNLQLKISKNEASINEIENEISSTEVKITTLQEEINKSEEVLSYRMRELYKDGSYSGISLFIYILQSDSFSDVFSRINTAKTLISMDNKLIKDINKNLSTLNKSKLILDEKKEEMTKLNEEIKLSLSEVKDKEKEIVNIRDNLAKEKSKISSIIKENEENLVRHQLNIIYSDNPTKAQLNEAISTLEGLLPQITTSSVITKVKNAISEAKYKITLLGQVSNESNNTTPPSDGNYKETYTMEATAYSGHGITAMGTVPVRNPNGISTVAVDPEVIPLGSKLYIPNYGYAIAADTGGVIKGMKIDLFMNSKEECYSFGRKQITVHLLALPGQW